MLNRGVLLYLGSTVMSSYNNPCIKTTFVVVVVLGFFLQNMSKRKVCVVGAGVIGISSAVCIQAELKDADVTVMADAFSPDTTGDGSAGFWQPHLLCTGQEDDILYVMFPLIIVNNCLSSKKRI